MALDSLRFRVSVYKKRGMVSLPFAHFPTPIRSMWSIRLGTSVRSRRFPPHSCAPCPAVDFAGGFNSLPRVWRWDAAGNLSLATFREVLPHFDSAKRLIEHFFDAGLPVPNLFREILVGGGERSPLYAMDRGGDAKRLAAACRDGHRDGKR